MDQQQLRLAIRAWLTGMLASVLLLWFVFHTSFRTSFWDAMAERPLGEAETAEVERCEEAPWWTWLKIVHANVEVPCGEVWVVEGLAERVRDQDRALWLQLRSDAADLPARTRMRIALALLIAGRPARDEPAWLLDELDEADRETWIRAAGRSNPIATQLGPRGAGLGALVRAERGGISEAELLPTLYWLAEVGDPGAEQAAVRTAAALAEVPPDLGDRIRARRAAGRPVANREARFARLVLDHPECGERCGALYAEILDQVLTEAALEDGSAPPVDSPEPPPIAEVLTAVEARVAERRAAARGIEIAASWVRAAPDPAARLRSLAAHLPDDQWSIARVAWNGAGTPLLSALVLAVIGESAGVAVEVRSDPAGALWFRIGGVDVPRACGQKGTAPDGSPWPVSGLVAGALLERARALAGADAVTARRLAMAAQRADPLVGGPLAAQLAGESKPELTVGRRIGASLLGPVSVPSGADAARRTIGEQGPPTCAAAAPAGEAPTL